MAASALSTLMENMTDHRTKFGLLIAQFIERAAFLGLAPFLPEQLQLMGYSEGAAAGLMAGFLCVSYLAAYPLGRLARILSARTLGLVACGLLAIGYLFLAMGGPLWGFGLGVAAGSALWRVVLPTVLATSSRPWWHVYLSTNLGCFVGAAMLQSLYWRHKGNLRPLAVLCAASVATVAASLPLLPGLHGSQARVKFLVEDSALRRQRLWAIRVVCFSAIGSWLVLLQSSTSLVIFAARHTTSGVFSIRLGTGSYTAIHGALVALVVVVALLRGSHEGVWQAIMSQIASAAAIIVITTASLVGLPASAWWLLGAYVLLSIGEPFGFVGSSGTIARLSPPDYRSRAFGLWYSCAGLGLTLGAVWGFFWDLVTPAFYFGAIGIVVLINAALLLTLSSRLQHILQKC